MAFGSTTGRQFPHHVEQPVDLLFRRVTGAADPHQSGLGNTEPLHRRRGVEVAV